MWTKIFRPPPDRMREFDNLMLRSAFVSLFWGVIKHRRKMRKLTLQEIAARMGTNKSAVSRWFSDQPPNWRLSTISEMAHTLDVDIRIEARDRATGMVFTPGGSMLDGLRPQHRDADKPATQTGAEQLHPTVRAMRPGLGVRSLEAAA